MTLSISACQFSPDEKISYNRDIRPIFNARCLSCHGGVRENGGFSLLFEADAFTQTESGKPAIVRGDHQSSELFQRLIHDDPEKRMPFEGEALSNQEIELIATWIDQGAEWEEHWAYIPPDPTIQVPKVREASWGSTEIDAFILKKLISEGLSPNEKADRASLLRRLSLDLIGLPPSLEEVAEFQGDSATNAYEKQVDRLLASPHFGERWASMWMDLARYADSKGYEKDLYRSIWKYRDWLIHAFNEDMPFDQFTVEQLAGDLLPNPTQSQLIATAFHRNTMANDEGGTDNEEFRNYANIERVGTTFEVWQSTTMSCVQCHSHPYDPFRHEDFYEFMAFFNNTQDRDIYHEGPNLFTYEQGDKEKVEEMIQWIDQQLKPEDKITPEGFLHERKEALLTHLGYRKIEAEHFDESSSFIELLAPKQEALFQIQDSSWIRFEEIDLTEVVEISFRYASPFGGFVEARLGSKDGPKIGEVRLKPTSSPEDRERWKDWRIQRMPIQATEGKQELFFTFRKDKLRDSDLFRIDWFIFSEKKPLSQKYGQAFQEKLEKLAFIRPTPTPILQDLPLDKRRTTYLFERGNYLTPGKEVFEKVPEVLGKLPDNLPPDRLTMARWLTSAQNPLTARVAVNRFWEQIFGYGIVETVEDMGTQSIPPTHPELLDWLAVRFATDWNWSIKTLIKEMVMSEAYRQSSAVDSLKLEKDPRNLFLSRGSRTRLSSEQVRDQILAVSGLLNPQMYGPSVKPPYPKGAGKFSFGDKYVVSDTANQRRRSLYTYIKRTNPFPNRITFDATDRTFCTSRRIRTNTPLQALALLNDPAYLEAAEAISIYIQGLEVDSEEERLNAAYQKVMLKEPDEKKLDFLEQLYTDALEQYGADQEKKAYTLVANALLNLDEFVNK